MPTKSEQIRTLRREGVAIAEIASRLGIRYQHAYKVCRDEELSSNREASAREGRSRSRIRKPTLTVDALLKGGFVRAGCWSSGEKRLNCPADLPTEAGVYAFSINDVVVYVGLASRSLAQRLYLYGNPGASQRTNVRLNAVIRGEIVSGFTVEIYYARPPDLEWNGFKISGAEGLESGLIREFDLPWNMRGTTNGGGSK